MAITNESLVKFLYGATGTPSSAAGEISFHSGNQAIYVGDGEKANLVTSSVKDAKFENNVLTITKVTGDTVTLDFSDVASAQNVQSLLYNLRTDVNANTTKISNLSSAVDGSINALDTAYKAADTALSNRITALETGDNSVAKQIETAINGLDSSANTDNDFFKLEVVEENGKVTGVNFTNKDVASAVALAGVKSTADAAATKTELTAHTGNTDIHITAQERTDWNAAKTAIDAFLNENAVSNDVVDTLKEIQEYITKDGSAAADMLDAIEAAQNAADAAQDDVVALEGTVSTLSSDFNTHSNNNDIHVTTTDKTQWNAAESNAKNYADGLAKNYDAAGAASTAESNAKKYADNISVNGQSQSSQNITVTGVNISVGGTGSHTSETVAEAIEALYVKVGEAEEAGVTSLAINSDSSKYAEVDKSTGAVSINIKPVMMADATSTNTGVADTYNVKVYVDAQIEAAALRWNILS